MKPTYEPWAPNALVLEPTSEAHARWIAENDYDTLLPLEWLAAKTANEAIERMMKQ